MKKIILLVLIVCIKHSFSQSLYYCALSGVTIVNPTNCACCGTISAIGQTTCTNQFLYSINTPTSINPTTPSTVNVWTNLCSGNYTIYVYNLNYPTCTTVCPLYCISSSGYNSPTNINELTISNRYNVYPNPANDVFNIEIQELNPSNTLRVKDYKLKIYNAIGQLVKEEEITFKENKAVINTKELANGVYILTLQAFDSAQADKKQNVSKRFVVAR